MSVTAVRVFALGMMLGVLLTACAPLPGETAPQTDATAETPAARIAVTADPRASAAAAEMLARGGSVADAAVAAQAVLGLVEPQASGLLGGSVLMVWQPGSESVTVYDGMPTAPAAAPRALAMTRDGKLLDPREVAFSARAVGVPGTLPALWAAHQALGKLPWPDLFVPAIRLATEGTEISRTLAALLAEPGAVAMLGEVARPYLAPGGTALPQGALYRNPAYAAVLERVARLGPDGLTAEGGEQAILEALGRGIHRSLITARDLQDYRPRISQAVCTTWEQRRLCVPPPPAMGGIVMLQILGLAGPGDPSDAAYVHRFLEASRLAEADRRRYLADPDFVPVPTDALLAPTYLAQRAALISPDRSLDRPRPGQPETAVAQRESDPGAPQSATSALAMVDGDGRVLSMTSTINLHFGARMGADGMVFNNALLNFAPPPPVALPNRGDRYANEMMPGKRPLSPIAPVIVFDAAGQPLLAGAGAGGPPIPDTMAMTLVRILAGHAAPGEALAAAHAEAADPDHTALEEGTAAADLRSALEAMGQLVAIEPIETGNVVLLREPAGWRGAADPRRDGAVRTTP